MQISSNHIFQFNLSRLPSDWIFAFYTSMHGVTGPPSFCSSIREVLLLIRFFFSLRVAFSQGFLMFYDNFVTSAMFLGSGMKWETSEPDSPKGINSCKTPFTTVLNTLCKPFPMLHVAFNAPFQFWLPLPITITYFITCFSSVNVRMGLTYVTNVF